jgi:hypothetical protein
VKSDLYISAMNDNNTELLFICPVSFLVKSDREQEISKGNARAEIEKEKLSLFTDSGETLVFPLRDLLEIRENDYHLSLPFSFDEHLDLFNLGFKFEDFARVLTGAHHELILQDMLAQEKIRLKDVGAHFTWFDSRGEGGGPRECKIRIFETSLVILPAIGHIVRIPLGRIAGVQPGDYDITVFTDAGEKVLFSRMGAQLDRVKKTLTDILDQLSLKTGSFLQELLPGTAPPTIRRLSHLLKEGKIAGRKEIEAISAAAWQEMEKKIAGSPLADEYAFLKSLGREEKVAVGFKRGLMGGLKQDYFWFLIPLCAGNGNPGNPGNAAAFEAGTIQLPGEEEENQEESLLKQEGKATYFFRLMEQEEYAALKDASILDRLTDELIISLNRCLQEINFRREPIYLPEEKLNDPAYSRYKYAVRRLPELQKLRRLFIGRVIHRSPEQWKSDVTALLEFNPPSPG